MPAAQSTLPGPSDDLLAELEESYKDIHANPELSMQEHRTAGIAAAWLKQHGYEVTEGVGGTGVVGLLRNGDGATVLLRADMDALPIQESTGLPYASQATGTDRFDQATAIAHSCGHDMHVAWLMGATRLLAENRGAWRGTVMAVFQPGEETAQGARAMIADGMVKRFPKPDVTLAQHVMPLSAGQIGWRTGTMLSAGDSWEVTLFGRGAHGSMPQKSIDPVVMAASAVMRLQAVVSREVAMTDSAVVTVGTLRAGMSENVIPDRALLRLNVRTFKDQVREPRAVSDQAHPGSRGDGLGRAEAARFLRPERVSGDPQRRGRDAEGGGCAGGAISARIGCTRSSPPRRARISACSAPPGTCLRCSGWSAASTRTGSRQPSRRASSTKFRPTTRRTSRR